MRGRRLLALLVLAAAALWVWHPVLRMSFASDTFLLPLLLGPGGEPDWTGVLQEWWRPWMGVPGAPNWRPLVTAHFALDLWLFGVEPAGFHLSNLACHLASGLLVWALIRKAVPAAGLFAAWIGAFLYLVHPARPEAVAWVPGRVDGTAALFAHLAALAFLHAGEAGRRARLLSGALSLVLALAAYAAKEMALALPATLLFLRWFRPAALRPSWWWFGLHATLLALVAAWRINVLGAIAGGSGPISLASDYLAGLPAKLAAAFLPDGAGGPLQRLLAWVALPLAAAWVRGPGALRAVAAFLWWGLLLVPASPIALYPDGSGARQLLMPALAAGVLLAILLGRPAPGRDLWPGNALRWAAGGAMAALALIGTRERLQDWSEATRLADQARQAIASRTRRPGEGPLAIAPLPVRPSGHVQPFRIDCAFLAFRRPFAPEDQETLVLDNALFWEDAGPLQQAATFSRELLAWMPAAGGFVDQRAADRGDEAVELASLACARFRWNGSGLLCAGGGGWNWLALPALARPSVALEGLDLLVESPSPELEIALAWCDPLPPREFPVQAADPNALGPRHQVRFHPLQGPSGIWRAACGNLAGFFGLHLWGRPVPLALAVRGEALLKNLVWRGRLPRAAWAPPPDTLLGPERFRIPVPPAFHGACRLVLITPAQVIEQFFQGAGQDSVALEPAVQGVLAFLERAVPRGRVYYYVDRLAAPGARQATLERTHVHAARLGG